MRMNLLVAAALAFLQPAQPPSPADLPAFESRRDALNAAIQPDSLRGYHTTLASEPHVAGTPGGERTVQRLRDAFSAMGLQPESWECWPLLPSPVAAELEVVSPERITLDLTERPVRGDPDSAGHGFGWNAYSGSGEVTAGIVYANYGTKADFERLRELNIDATGKIIIARYGGNYRGYKAKFAQAAGAAGLIIYTDPADSGYMRGLTYPEGGFANDCCIQRGSIVTLPYIGDPLTPGIPATQDAQRLDIDDIALPRIPVQPASYAAAKEILSRMTGQAVPEGWQGGLPFTYRVEGGEDLRVRLNVQQERKVTKATNVLATITGSTYPEQMVIVGCHHDAWNNGAADPLAGTIALLECAKAFAALAKDHPPLRTIVFATWDAEEFGIIGSSEWVEAHRDSLTKNAVAYINLDMASMGLNFGSSASPSLRTVIAQAAGDVPQPHDPEGRTVAEVWKGAFGDLGGGSDHVAFLCHAGVPSCSLGGGGSKGVSYHSAYDTLPWYWKTVGTDYASAQMVARMTAATVHRLAYAPTLPLDQSQVAADTLAKLTALEQKARDAGLMTQEAEQALAAARAAAAALEQAAASLQHAAAGLSPSPAADDRLLAADRAWLSDDGLPNRPWFRSRYAAPDEDSGYASWILPGVCKALSDRDSTLLTAEFQRITESLTRAAAALQPPPPTPHSP
jgi:N-acetylated-alpha-linked acidic dipeptidase